MTYQKKNKPRKYTGKSYNLPPKTLSFEDRALFNNLLRERIRTIGLAISEANGATLAEVCQKTRKGGVVLIRQIIHKIAKEITNAPFWLVADEIGGKDHATCIHSIKVINDYIDSKNKLVTAIYQESERVAKGMSSRFEILPATLDHQFIHNMEHCPQF